MPIESKEVLSYLGFDEKEVDSIDKLKEKFDGEFVRKTALKDYNSDAHKEFFPVAIGRLDGSIRKDLFRMAKEKGIEIVEDEFKGKRLEDVVAGVYGKTAETFTSKITDLESKAGAGKDELVKEWESKYEKEMKLKNQAGTVRSKTSSLKTL